VSINDDIVMCATFDVTRWPLPHGFTATVNRVGTLMRRLHTRSAGAACRDLSERFSPTAGTLGLALCHIQPPVTPMMPSLYGFIKKEVQRRARREEKCLATFMHLRRCFVRGSRAEALGKIVSNSQGVTEVTRTAKRLSSCGFISHE
jgi:hypothetical protein